MKVLLDDPADLVISDWNMPGMTGIELLDKVKSLPDTADMSFVIVTTDTEKKNVIQAVKDGVSGYLIKPFEGPDLAWTLERALKRPLGSGAAAVSAEETDRV
mgnify:CR=1 FL=1